MEVKLDYHNQSMDEIVFDKRNKNYGAYVLRQLYDKHLLKALSISVGVFIFSMYTPTIAKNLGLFKEKQAEVLDTTTIVLQPPPSIKPDEPPPPPPPPVEPVLRPTVRFLEMEAVKKEEVDEPPPPTIDQLDKKDIGVKDVAGEGTDDPPPPGGDVGGGAPVAPKFYERVEQMPSFIGDLQGFLGDNLQYPTQEYNDEVTGVTLVYFIVNSEGVVEDVALKETSGHKALDAEALRVVKLLAKDGKVRFKAGKQNGAAVPVRCVVPIEFTIE